MHNFIWCKAKWEKHKGRRSSSLLFLEFYFNIFFKCIAFICFSAILILRLVTIDSPEVCRGYVKSRYLRGGVANSGWIQHCPYPRLVAVQGWWFQYALLFNQELGNKEGRWIHAITNFICDKMSAKNSTRISTQHTACTFRADNYYATSTPVLLFYFE